MAQRRRSTGLTASSGRGWSTSPAGTCRSSTPASSPSTRRCAPRPVCSTSRTWGRLSSAATGRSRRANALITNDLGKASDGQAVYAGLLNDQGGFVDDVVAYRFSPEHILICVNASNRDKDFAWMTRARPGREAGQPRATTSRSSPSRARRRRAWCSAHRRDPLESIATYRFTRGRGGRGRLHHLAHRLHRRGRLRAVLRARPTRSSCGTRSSRRAGRRGWCPRGSGARDTLRTEMKYALYGNDIDDAHTPLEAGLGWIVKLDKGELHRRGALAEQKAAGVPAQAGGLRDDVSRASPGTATPS